MALLLIGTVMTSSYVATLEVSREGLQLQSVSRDDEVDKSNMEGELKRINDSLGRIADSLKR